MLRTKIFKHLIVVILFFALLSVWFGIRVIRQRIIDEAQERTRLDLKSAWSVYHAAANERMAALRLLARQKYVVDTCATANWSEPELQQQLRAVRQGYRFDFLTLASVEGIVVVRSAPPYHTGDSCLHLAGLGQVLTGQEVSGTVLLSGVEAEREAEGLAERAFIEVEDTPKASLTPKKQEGRAMVTITAVPVLKGGQLAGVLYGGVVLNRNADLIDSVCTSVYGDVDGQGSPAGTATIFLQDTRIATTVRKENGNRAVGSRVSREVAERVLHNGRPWIGRAFVVNGWYLTAYDPIRDLDANVIGMLYVGTLERPFRDVRRGVVYRYAALTGVALALAFVVAFVLANSLARPIHDLAEATHDLRAGTAPQPIVLRGASKETDGLATAFNQMAQSLQEREQSLRQANASLEKANRNYMELLGFVSHELKNPIGVMGNCVCLLETEMGPNRSAEQHKTFDVLNRNLARMTEMVRHYLNLSRIEEGLLTPTCTQVNVLRDVLAHTIEAAEPEMQKRRMSLVHTVADSHLLYTDLNMTGEVFENLLSNAIKYGREGGQISISATEEGGFIRFRVRNEGEGIPRERLGGLFKRFSRIEELQASSQQKGTGLGLFITRKIVEAHGGNINVDSEPGNWVEFSFTLPRFCQNNLDAGVVGR